MAKDNDKGSVIASARTVKVRRTAADAVTNHSKTGNHAWTKSVLQVSFLHDRVCTIRAFSANLIYCMFACVIEIWFTFCAARFVARM